MATFSQARKARSKAYIHKADKALVETPCPWCGELQAELEMSDCDLCWRIHYLSYEIVACDLVKAALYILKHEARWQPNEKHALKQIPRENEEGTRVSPYRDRAVSYTHLTLPTNSLV